MKFLAVKLSLILLLAAPVAVGQENSTTCQNPSVEEYSREWRGDGFKDVLAAVSCTETTYADCVVLERVPGALRVAECQDPTPTRLSCTNDGSSRPESLTCAANSVAAAPGFSWATVLWPVAIVGGTVFGVKRWKNRRATPRDAWVATPKQTQRIKEETVAATTAAPDAKPSHDPSEQCIALTQQGNQCKRNATTGPTCAMHDDNPLQVHGLRARGFYQTQEPEIRRNLEYPGDTDDSCWTCIHRHNCWPTDDLLEAHWWGKCHDWEYDTDLLVRRAVDVGTGEVVENPRLDVDADATPTTSSTPEHESENRLNSSALQKWKRHKEQGLSKWLLQAEGQHLEFKASAVFSPSTSEATSEQWYEMTKAMAGFLNARGGVLLIGVRNDGTVTGLQPDYDAIRGNQDKWRLRLIDTIHRDLGPAAASLIDINVANHHGFDVAIVTVEPSPTPVFTQRDDFLVRQDARTKRMTPRETQEYTKSEF